MRWGNRRPGSRGDGRLPGQDRLEQSLHVGRVVLQVGVEDRQEVAARRLDPRADRRALPPVVASADQPDPIRLGQVGDRLQATVRGPVVNDQKLGRDRKRRLHHALHGGPQRGPLVVHGHDDAERGRCRHPAAV